MSKTLKVSVAVDKIGASPENDGADDKVQRLSPSIKYNEELNGYHFHFFNKTFICREELPQGSETFRQVLDEITDSLDTTQISEKPTNISDACSRRKSVATMARKMDTLGLSGKSTKKRRVSWGKQVEPITTNSIPSRSSSSSSSSSFYRPRVCSDGDVLFRRKSLNGRR